MSPFPRPPRSFELSPYMAPEAEPQGRDAGTGRAGYEATGFDGAAYMEGAAAPSHSWLDPDLVPTWLRPFTLDANTRFTRTPDHLLRPREADAASTAELPGRGWHFILDPADDEAAALDVVALVAGEETPPEEARADDARQGDAPQDQAAPDQPVPDQLLPDHAAQDDAASDGVPLQDVPEEGPPEAERPAAATVNEAVREQAPEPAFAVEGAVDPAADAAGEGLPAEVPDLAAGEAEAAALPVALDAPSAPMPDVPPTAEIGADPASVVPAPLRALGRLLLLGGDAIPPRAAAEQDLAPSAVQPRVELPEDAAPALSADEAAPVMAAVSEEPAVSFAEGEIDVVADSGPAPAHHSTDDAPSACDPAPSAADGASEAAPVPDIEPAGDLLAPLWQPYQQTITARFLAGAAAPAMTVPAAVAPSPMGAVPDVVPAVTPATVPDADAEDDDAPAGRYELPPLDLLCEPPVLEPDYELSEEFLDQSSTMLQQVLRDFGVRGEVIDANPGPVVTLYEFEPAPGVKSSRVIGLAPDIARSMSAVSARVAVVEGRNVIGIELPNRRRDTVWLRELLASTEFVEARSKLGLCLGKTIGGVPVIADLARMPHLLVAGTTGSGKSVAINTMILSLLYRHTPEACRLIMIDPKMLELSVYEGIPHLLTQVVTDPKKAIIALKWAVKEMEERYRKMSRLAVRNIDGFNARMKEAAEKGEVITRQVPVGFDRETGEALFEEQEMDLTALPHIVVIVDEMADLMMVAGKEIEGAIQRLAQMARAAGIHLVMATQRPSVDVITGTIKANFPTRISFQVTSKIDSRTILGEMGAETLLGQGDMLFMAGGGRITRVHGPFVSDGEVEKVVAFLKAQGGPDYLDAVILDEEAEPAEDEDAVFDRSALGDAGGDLYEQAVAIVMRDRKASTSYIQRRLQVGYNKAASLMERMETEGIVGAANHAGKREILSFSRTD